MGDTNEFADSLLAPMREDSVGDADAAGKGAASRTASRQIWVLTLFACIGGFLFGYDTGVISGALLFMKDDFSLTNLEQEMVVSGATAGALVGALCGALLLDRVGRRPCIMMAAAVFIAGSAVQAAAINFHVLLVGRLIIGVGIGVASTAVPVYIAEVAPPAQRGYLTSLNVVFITGGQFISYLVDSAFAEVPGDWRWMVGLAVLPATIQLVGMWFLPETPRFLIAKRREHEAREVMRVLWVVQADEQMTAPVLPTSEAGLSEDWTPSSPSSYQSEDEKHGAASLPAGDHQDPTTARLSVTEASIDAEVANIKAELRASASTDDSWSALCSDRAIRRALGLAVMLQCMQQFCGINTAMYYSATIMRMAGVDSNTLAILLSDAVALTNVLGSVLAMRLVDKRGRRRLLLVSVLIAMVGMATLGLTFYGISEFSTKRDHCSSYQECTQCVMDLDCGWCDAIHLVPGNLSTPLLPAAASGMPARTLLTAPPLTTQVLSPLTELQNMDADIAWLMRERTELKSSTSAHARLQSVSLTWAAGQQMCVAGDKDKAKPYSGAGSLPHPPDGQPLVSCAKDNYHFDKGCGMKLGGVFAMGALVLYVFGFSIGLSPIPWTVNAEIFPQHARGKANGIATAANWLTNLLVSMTFLTMAERLSVAVTFWVYAGLALISFWLAYRFVFETKGMSLEAIAQRLRGEEETQRLTEGQNVPSDSVAGYDVTQD